MSFPAVSSSPAVAIAPQVQPEPASDLAKIRDLTEQIRQRCMQAQLSGQQQTFQLSQAEEVFKRLKEVTSKLQDAVKDYSLGSVGGQLEQVAAHTGLKFETRRSPQTQTCSFFISSDAFYVEVCCQATGHVVSVRLVQSSQQEDSDVLCKLLRCHDYTTFEQHLSSLTEFYKQASSSSDYQNMHRALSAIEKEGIILCDKSPQLAVSTMIMKNPFGLVTPRKAGLSQYLTIFVHPHEVLRNPTLSKTPPVGVANSSLEIDLSVGVAAKINVEKSFQVNRLSVRPLFDYNTANFVQLTEQNSVPIALNFMLVLTRPVPTCGLILDKLHDAVLNSAGGSEPRVTPSSSHVNQLIAQAKAKEEGRDIFADTLRVACLPEQRHYFFMPAELQSSGDSQIRSYPSSICGTILNKVVFRHPVELFSIIPLLRKQLMYNTLMESCLGRSMSGLPAGYRGSEYMFKLLPSPPDSISVTMDTQDSHTEQCITVDFFVPDQEPTNVVVHVKVGGAATTSEQPHLAEIARRCLSIPVSMAAALKHPEQLLGPLATKALNAYHADIQVFNKELGTASVARTVSAGGAEEMAYIGMKRKRSD